MKIIKSNDIGKLIKDNDTILISGSGGSGSPEALIKGVMNSYIETGHPKDITVSCGISPGNLTDDDVGMNMLAKKGLVKKAICAHLGMGKVFGNAIGKNEFAAFAVPLGVVNHLYRAIAAHEIGIITRIGLDTFADPRIEGCCANEKAKELDPIVELIKLDDTETLFYKSFPVDVALLKATYSDIDGNISFEHEAVIGEQYNMAIAAHNNNGIVIVEVEKIKPKNSIKAKDVIIHSSYVDYVVVSKQDKSLGEYNIPIHRPELSGVKKIRVKDIKIRPLDERKICGRRSLMELKKGDIVNLGVGMPDSVSNAAAEEGIFDEMCLSLETGPIGGIPIGGIAFGVSINPECIVSTPSQFDAYNGGILDVAVLGLAQVDKYGNVNVSKFGTRVTGPGGFINITQSAKKVIFMGTFTAVDLRETIISGNLNIENEGKIKKFVNQLEQITFSAKNAINNNQEIVYVTERAVFKLTDKGLLLTEIASGIDLKKDILEQMEFTPSISDNLKIMDKRIYENKKMNLII